MRIQRTDMDTSERLDLDAGSMYTHNEHEIGIRRASPQRLSNERYIRNYKGKFSMSKHHK